MRAGNSVVSTLKHFNFCACICCPGNYNIDTCYILALFIICTVDIIAMIILQFQVQATDQGIPRKSTVANVVITIQRDEGPPQFMQSLYTLTILETAVVNDTLPIVTVSAADNIRVSAI